MPALSGPRRVVQEKLDLYRGNDAQRNALAIRVQKYKEVQMRAREEEESLIVKNIARMKMLRPGWHGDEIKQNARAHSERAERVAATKALLDLEYQRQLDMVEGKREFLRKLGMEARQHQKALFTQHTWATVVAVGVRLQVLREKVADLAKLHARNRRELAAALVLQRATRRFLKRVREWKREQAILTLQKFYRKYYLGKAVMRRRAKALQILHFLQDRALIPSFASAINRYRARVVVCQRAFRQMKMRRIAQVVATVRMWEVAEAELMVRGTEDALLRLRTFGRVLLLFHARALKSDSLLSLSQTQREEMARQAAMAKAGVSTAGAAHQPKKGGKGERRRLLL